MVRLKTFEQKEIHSIYAGHFEICKMQLLPVSALRQYKRWTMLGMSKDT